MKNSEAMIFFMQFPKLSLKCKYSAEMNRHDSIINEVHTTPKIQNVFELSIMVQMLTLL
jgi:hypothetical protein